MHRKLKSSSEVGALLFYFHLDELDNIGNNLLLNRGVTQREVPVTTAEFKVIHHISGYLEPIPHPPLCESDELYRSQYGDCKSEATLTEREELRYIYTF